MPNSYIETNDCTPTADTEENKKRSHECRISVRANRQTQSETTKRQRQKKNTKQKTNY